MRGISALADDVRHRVLVRAYQANVLEHESEVRFIKQRRAASAEAV